LPSNHVEVASTSLTESLPKKLTGSTGDGDIHLKFEEERQKGEGRHVACLSFLKEKVTAQTQVNEQLGAKILEDDKLFKLMRGKIAELKAKLCRDMEARKKSKETSVDTKTEDEQKELARRLTEEKSKHLKSDPSLSTELLPDLRP